MAINITVANIATVTCGNAGSFAVNLESMPQASLDYIFAYGLKQCLSDARSAAKSADEAKGMVQKKLDALLAGTIRVAGSRTTDPVGQEAKRLARLAIDAALKAKRIKRADLPEGKYAEAVTKYAAREDVLAQAKANVDSAGDLADDIADLI